MQFGALGKGLLGEVQFHSALPHCLSKENDDTRSGAFHSGWDNRILLTLRLQTISDNRRFGWQM
jgi:hypothetical protein